MGTMLDAPWLGEFFSPPTPLDIASIENAIVAQLRALIGSVEVAHYPDRPESYRLTHRVGAALVVFRGSEYGKPLASDEIVQKRTLRFEVDLVMRDLGWGYGGDLSGGAPGAYAMLEAVRAALTGFAPPGCKKAYPVREGFVARDPQGGVWIYQMTFELPTLAVENLPVSAYPTLSTVLALEKGGVTTVAVAGSPFTFDATGEIRLPYRNVSGVVVSNPLGGAVYVAGRDYALDAVKGFIAQVAGGAIAAGATVEVAYSYAETVTAVAGGGNAPTAPTN